MEVLGCRGSYRCEGFSAIPHRSWEPEYVLVPSDILVESKKKLSNEFQGYVLIFTLYSTTRVLLMSV